MINKSCLEKYKLAGIICVDGLTGPSVDVCSHIAEWMQSREGGRGATMVPFDCVTVLWHNT